MEEEKIGQNENTKICQNDEEKVVQSEEKTAQPEVLTKVEHQELSEEDKQKIKASREKMCEKTFDFLDNMSKRFDFLKKTDIVLEYQLVNEKKSNLSASQRKVVSFVYELVYKSGFATVLNLWHLENNFKTPKCIATVEKKIEKLSDEEKKDFKKVLSVVFKELKKSEETFVKDDVVFLAVQFFFGFVKKNESGYSFTFKIVDDEKRVEFQNLMLEGLKELENK